MASAVLQFIKTYKLPLLLVLSCIFLYAAFAYDLQRWDFTKLITLYAALLFLSYKINSVFKGNFCSLVAVSVVFRLIFLLAIPNLSQDFYRFLWDGQLLLEGINPYLYTPRELLQINQNLPNTNQLLDGMGNLSATNYSNYPPVNQLLFALAALVGKMGLLPGIIGLRLIIIAADLGILYFGKKLLKRFDLPEERIFWYLLNPFIIIEFAGNLHFEGVMLFFVLAALYLLFTKRRILAAIVFGISVSVKLIPLLFLPVLYRYLAENSSKSVGFSTFLGGFHFNWAGFLNTFSFYLIVIFFLIVSFLPFLSVALLENFAATTALWFQKFEFNASLYYLIRWIGFQQKGFNIIADAGPALSIATLILVLCISFLRDNKNPKAILTAMLFSISVYYFFATTVHPWYLATPLLLCIFTPYRFPFIWTAVAFLSYSAYGENGFSENLWLVTVEYALVLGYGIWEIYKLESVSNNKQVSSF